MIVRSLIAPALCAFTLVAAGCGGSSTTATSSTATESEATKEAADSTATQNAANDVGAKIFASNCAQCHTLSAAGSNGQVGPNLDELAPDEATVKQQVTNGGSGMPAFADVLSNAEIDAVAAYVADSTGQ